MSCCVLLLPSLSSQRMTSMTTCNSKMLHYCNHNGVSLIHSLTAGIFARPVGTVHNGLARWQRKTSQISTLPRSPLLVRQ
ncbi:hypothetical protein F4604DRAFT_1713369 [Suillus subluteus]|nr:hypothetical protein F4604DRAFT_1713369 [Suillus subluteus]